MRFGDKNNCSVVWLTACPQCLMQPGAKEVDVVYNYKIHILY